MIVHTVVLAIAIAFPGHTEQAICVAKAESNLTTTAISHTGDYGLFQINHRSHPQYTRKYLLTLRGNLKAAVRISRHGRDWSSWAPRTRRICGV